MPVNSAKLPSTDGPGYESIQIAVLDSNRVSTHTVGATMTSHICNPSCDFVEIHVSGDDGILIANVASPADAQMLDLLPGTHFYGLLDGGRTLRWKAIGADTVVKVLEVV
ncbi:hypothetical protein G6M78_04670 [Agrobacterium tumefaciens]|uniref:hypothetical protein n=1 Tax=Agrobacterium tumefaciens TaxID=358 RepID=UPI0004590359|nr:hypothetical protein [Agrobacterium tumefaciens]AMD59408.1 hypothetical protein AWN88_14135 [Agrobacterium tumefaciens]KAJ34026.1 hypothetical protein BW45_06290 [Agrobacterium tumefaciens]NTE54367.1 hypothetical protein [Agrobacterium tumefaciens]NTE70532.1 hypothetical protein [Agrobacterium tumefaciens]